MIQVGITGQSGFIGNHLFQYLNMKEDICCIPFQDSYFENENKLNDFTSKCDAIIHLAALHRDPVPERIIEINRLLTTGLLNSCNNTERCKQIIFTSSIQEKLDNPYGISKKESRLKIEQWSKEQNKKSLTLLLPNIFGPGAKPFHTSFIATFSHQLFHGQEPVIIEDREVSLFSIMDLLPVFYESLKMTGNESVINLQPMRTISVSQVLQLLKNYHHILYDSGSIHSRDHFEIALYKTFCSYITSGE